VQPFATVQTRRQRCELHLDGAAKPLDLQPMRPNGIIPPTTPPAGITGPIVHAGAGRAEDFMTAQARGAVVVLDYNAGTGWLRAFRLGARAVIFVPNGPVESRHSHTVEANANLPRYYYDGPRDDLAAGATATIHSEIVWDGVTGRNVFGFFTGSKPAFPKAGETEEKDKAKEELIVVSARLDSFGEVPDLSPGARGAANCAALLKLAEHFKEHPPRRHVLVAFFDGQSRNLLGSGVFYRSLEEKDDRASVEARQTSLDSEADLLKKMKALLGEAAPLQAALAASDSMLVPMLGMLAALLAAGLLAASVIRLVRQPVDDAPADAALGLHIALAAIALAVVVAGITAAAVTFPREEKTEAPGAGVRRELLHRLRERAEDHTNAVKGTIYDLNFEKQQLRKTWDDVEPDDLTAKGREARERIQQITDEVKTQWLPVKDEWNTLRRALGKDDTEDIAPVVRQKLRLIMDEVRENVGLRDAELASERDALAAATAVKTLIGEYRNVLHTSLMLGDTTEQWGVVVGGDSATHSWSDSPGQYGGVKGTFLRAYEEMAEEGRAPAHFLAPTVDQKLRPTRTLWAAPAFVHGGEVAGLFGVYNLALATCQERLPREGTPDDTLDRLDLGRIETQVDEIAALLSAVAERKGLSVKSGIVPGRGYVWPKFDDRVRGAMVMGMLPGSSVPNTPMPGAIVRIGNRIPTSSLAYNPRKHYAFDSFQIVRTTQNGTYSVGPLPGEDWPGFAVIFDERGMAASVSDSMSSLRIRGRLNVFRCWHGALVLPPQIETVKIAGTDVLVMSSRANAALDPKKSFTSTSEGLVTWWADERIKGIKLFGLERLVGLNNEAAAAPDEDEDEEMTPGRRAQGFGFLAESGEAEGLRVTRSSGGDLWRLNESRLAVLRERDIRDSSVEELHGRSEDWRAEADETSFPLRSEALDASAFWASQPVYTQTRGTLDDLVFAVLILLGLSVPFAFAVERMVIGSTTIYRQISWFAALFAATFLVLYLSHPAFALANTPIIIFLGFAIVVLSVLVIAIIMRKFEVELKALQGMTATVHAADVSRVSTFVAAMQMGISTMRRRPLRTALTATTIILLTFTILCFASFGTRLGIITIFSEPSPPYAGAFVHRVNWEVVNRDVLDVLHGLRGRWGESVSVHRREWICPNPKAASQELLLTRHDGSRPRTITGVLGIDPAEIRSRRDLAALFGDGLDDETIRLTKAVASELKVKPGDTVILRGRSLRVGRLLDPVTIMAAKDMDGSGILPVDFTEVSSVQQTPDQRQQQSAEAMLARRQWTSMSADRVAVVSARTAHAMGAELYGVTLLAADTATAQAIAEDLSRMLPFPVAATRSNGVYLHVLGPKLAASGAGDLFFPILLGGLVIFGTMLGSVADREKEIYTFSALGLAPRHVATLFFAESMVYSLVGGMGGYLLAQGSLKILTLLAAYGVGVPEINMSSTNTVVTILIVMATVLVSAIYPAIKASKSANPGLMRSWRAPEPKGNVLDIVFPFTVSEYDITGVVSFLKEHFDNHSDTGLGRFIARDAEVTKQEGGGLGLDASLALAPFDVGVSQTFALRTAPSEIPGIDEVHLRLERRSGQPKDWRRLNKVFLDDLRRQFLIWRSIPQETMEFYRDQTLTAFGAARQEAGGQARQEAGGQPEDEP